VAKVINVTSMVRKDTEAVLASGDVIEVIKHFDALRKAMEQIKTAREALDQLKDQLSTVSIPDMFRARDIKNMKIEGVGRCGVSYRFSCSIVADDKRVGHQWLKDNGYPDLVVETVNSSTLSAFAKNLLETEGKELPAEIFKTSSSPFTSITKA